jgi:hypothetical protein
LRWLREWREPIAIFLGFRLGLEFLTVWAGTFIPSVARNGTAPYSLPPMNRWGERLLGVWTHWDGEWYLALAQSGYHGDDGSSAFFPLFPLLIKLLAFLLGGNYLLAGILLSSAATLAAFILLYELVSREFNREMAGRTVLYLAVFPTAFFFSAIYSEGLFLALALGAFLAARHYRNWWLTALLVALATLTRSQGILIAAPLAWEWWRQQQPQFLQLELPILKKFNLNFTAQLGSKPGWVALCFLVVLPVLALLGWLLFNAVALQDPFNFINVQRVYPWNRKNGWPWETIWNGAQIFFTSRGPEGFLPTTFYDDPNLINFPFLVFALALFAGACWYSWKQQLPFSYLLYFGLGLLFPLLSPAFKQPLFSFPRFALALFPAFIVMAIWGGRGRWIHYTYLFGAVLLLSLLFIRFANWYWVS